MPQLTATLTLSYGDTLPVGQNVPLRTTLTFNLTYAEKSLKTVAVPASSTAFPVALDSVTRPKFLFVRALDVDVEIGLSDGSDTVPTQLAAADGWLQLCTPNGQDLNEITITTPVSPASGAHVEILAFE
jgi:hypothetical protein